MEFRGRRWLLIFSLFHCLALAEYIHKGCYDPRNLGLRSQGHYDYPSISNCQQQCNNSPLVAIQNGDECLCGDSTDMPPYARLAPGLCNVKCKGSVYQGCGGNSSVDLYEDSARLSHSHESASISQIILTNTLTSRSSTQSSNAVSSSPSSNYVSDTWSNRFLGQSSPGSVSASSVSTYAHSTWTTGLFSQSHATPSSNSFSSYTSNTWYTRSRSSDTVGASSTSSYTLNTWTESSLSWRPSTSSRTTDSYTYSILTSPPPSQSSKNIHSSSISSYISIPNTWTSPPPSRSAGITSSGLSSSYTFSIPRTNSGSSSSHSTLTSISSSRSPNPASNSSTPNYASSTFSSSGSTSSSTSLSSSDSGQGSSFVTSYYHNSSTLSTAGASTSGTATHQTSQSVRTVSTSTASPLSTGYVTEIVPTIVTRHDGNETIFMTTTAFQLPSAYQNLNDKSTNPKTGDLSGGAIAGIVIGVIVGVLIILLCAGFYLWRRHSLNKELLDLEETKHYQPYSFGDADATSIESPSRNGSIWRKGSSTALSSLYGSVPTAFMSESVSKSSINSLLMMEDAAVNHMRPNMPSTVFEEPPSIYNGNQRFSTGSLPDMMQERNLIVANPDGRRSHYPPSHYSHNGHSKGKFDDVKEDDEEVTFSAGSSGGSYNG